MGGLKNEERTEIINRKTYIKTKRKRKTYKER